MLNSYKMERNVHYSWKILNTWRVKNTEDIVWRQTSNARHSFVSNKLVGHSDEDLTSGFNGLGKDNWIWCTLYSRVPL